MSSAIKSFLILLATLPLMIYIGSEIGSEEYFVPMITGVLLFLGLIVALFFRGQRLECLVLLFLVGGYIVGNRGFAQLAVVQPLFVGELGLATIMVCMLVRYATSREFAVPRHGLAWLIGAFLIFAFALFCFDFSTYGIDTARDSAIAYYAIFFFVAYQLGRRDEVAIFFNRGLVWAFLLQAVITTVFIFYPDLLEVIQVRGVPLLAQKADLTGTFSAAGVIFLALHPERLPAKWIRRPIVMLLAFYVVLLGSRAAMVAVCTSLPLIWVAGRRGFVVVPVMMAGLAFIALLALSQFMPDRLTSLRDQVSSVFDVSGTGHYSTDFGDEKQADNRFREALWHSIYQQTVGDNWLIGKGFGYDFIPIFEREFRAGSWEGLRSAHNYFVTVFGRMGVLGTLLLAGIVFEIVRLSTRSALALRRGQEVTTNALSYWCCGLIILTSGTFGVVMEGPMGAIPFWSFLGLALATDDKRNLEARAAAALSLPLIETASSEKPSLPRRAIVR